MNLTTYYGITSICNLLLLSNLMKPRCSQINQHFYGSMFSILTSSSRNFLGNKTEKCKYRTQIKPCKLICIKPFGIRKYQNTLQQEILKARKTEKGRKFNSQNRKTIASSAHIQMTLTYFCYNSLISLNTGIVGLFVITLNTLLQECTAFLQFNAREKEKDLA